MKHPLASRRQSRLRLADTFPRRPPSLLYRGLVKEGLRADLFRRPTTIRDWPQLLHRFLIFKPNQTAIHPRKSRFLRPFRGAQKIVKKITHICLTGTRAAHRLRISRRARPLRDGFACPRIPSLKRRCLCWEIPRKVCHFGLTLVGAFASIRDRGTWRMPGGSAAL